MTTQLETPVLLLVFRRPETTRKVLDAVRVARPRRLYVSAPGARGDADREACARTRALFDEVDWPCDVRRNFWPDSHGCRADVARGIGWVFEHEEQAIILEDDCVPSESFFRFCSENLARYRDDERVMSVSGTNFLFGETVTADSYFFSRYVNIWGWATWRRAWRHYDRDLELWEAARREGWLRDVFERSLVRCYWTLTLDLIRNGALDTWDFPWMMSCWLQHGLSLQPTVNLVRNVGFGAEATHTTRGGKLSRMAVSEMAFPLRHPRTVIRNTRADRRIERTVYATPMSVLALRWHTFVHGLPRAWKDRVRSLLGISRARPR